ncbi:MAG: hypothetical protein HY400_07485 [Elusimicrobia bacterium]|nr:hypothetical protein [Elusimicrobiota bacterium]
MRFLSEKRRAFLWVLASRIVPEAKDLDAQARERFFNLIENALSSKPDSIKRQIALFLFVLKWFPALRYGGSLDRLPPKNQDSALMWFQEAPVALIRKGFWGIKTLIFMGYYGRPEVGEGVHYRPSKKGNELL